MELIRGGQNIRPRHYGCVASLGNFDGMHLGHQAVLSQLRDASNHFGVPSTAIIFEPQPAEYFHPVAQPPRLSALREKLMMLTEFGIDRVCVLRFDEYFAAQTAEEFAIKTLVEGLGIRELIIGDDFKFGSARGGDFFALQAFGREYDFTVRRTNSYILDGERVSSTSVRQKLIDGDLAGANKFLGRRYFIAGRVVHGQHRGRSIGFPTANLKLNRIRAPLNGIYASYVAGLGPGLLPSVTYVGSRPIIEDPTYVVETHVLNYGGKDFYGCHLKVEFVEKLRDDSPFESFEKLRQQIVIDCDAARDVLNLNTKRVAP
ncbi:MAG: bifunctional riboflavin kinase/FAD synthetase [Proteobacteria bacterium]|nr:bifunctional riboflavin kinase/FAD synthetase [Pseudomonadota bacterium]